MNHCPIEKLTQKGSNPNRKVIAFCGAGGKTSCIHAIRDYYLSKNRKVLVATTTHMFYEEGCVSNVNDIVKKLDHDGYAFAGIPMHADRADAQTMTVCRQNKTPAIADAGRLPAEKISAIADADRLIAESHADVTLIEADGARCLPFKVPKPWEPVIPEETTDIVLVMGMDAEGKRISDICYNPEGAADILGVPPWTCLTKEMMIRAYFETYVLLIRRKFKSARVFLYMNDKVPGKTIVDCGLFMV